MSLPHSFLSGKGGGLGEAVPFIFNVAGQYNLTLTAATYLFVLGGGGGGAGIVHANSRGGHGGVFAFTIPVSSATTLELGVGGGSGGPNSYSNSGSYPMYGNSTDSAVSGKWAGGGGGGTYIKTSSTSVFPVYSDLGYLAIVGGGGGAAFHDFFANKGGDGYGQGGGGYDSQWAGTGVTGGSTWGNGGGPTSSGSHGGDPSYLNQYVGAYGRDSTVQPSGAGGGGAGGGGGGAGGGAGKNGWPGGYLGATALNDHPTWIATSGGGGGGSHGNSCGGAGGGGGAILYDQYVNKVDTTFVNNVPPNNTLHPTIDDWAAWGLLSIEHKDLITAGLSVVPSRGGNHIDGDGTGSDGFIFAIRI